MYVAAFKCITEETPKTTTTKHIRIKDLNIGKCHSLGLKEDIFHASALSEFLLSDTLMCLVTVA